MPKNITTQEHYVPQVYLRGFSQDEHHVYEYRVRDGFQPEKAVPIDSICRGKYLYELKDEK